MHLRLKPLPFFAGKVPSETLNSRHFRDLEDSLVTQLSSLNPNPNSISSFSSLSRIIDILSSAHHLLENLLSDDHFSNEAAICSYLRSSVKVLDLCNEISQQINKLRHGRLLVLYAIHLLSSPDTFSLYKAREIMQQWETSTAENTISKDLTRNLVNSAITALDDFASSEAFNKLRDSLSSFGHGDVKEEIRAVVKRCFSQIDDAVEKKVATELAGAAERLGMELDSLGGAADALFRAVLSARSAALKKYRMQKTRCYAK